MTFEDTQFTWHKGTLFLPKLQTTLQVWPGKDSEQYPGKPKMIWKKYYNFNIYF